MRPAAAKDDMNPFHSLNKSPLRWASALLAVFVAGCGNSGIDPILGSPGAGAVPTITATSPLASTPVVTGVARNSRVTATFSKPMAPTTIASSSFSLACPAATPVAAAVTYDAATRVATLTPNALLPAGSLCVATVTTAAQDTMGFALASNFVWSFVTVPGDLTRPTVTLTVPAAAAANVASNTQLSATFSEDMLAATLSASSFTVTNTTLGSAVAGSVSYSVAARTATFTPSTPSTLAANTLFTATITTAATDLAGNALAGNSAVLPGAGNHVWSFTTGATGDSIAPTVVAISPPDGTAGVCLTRTVSATFSEPMDAATINATNFSVTDNGVAVAGSVSYNAASQIASFVPSNVAGFAASRPLVVTVRSGSTGVKDLAGNALAVDRTWGFSTGTLPCTTAAGGVNLRTAAAYGAFGGGAGVTNQGLNTVVGGNLGTTAACTLVTGFHDASNVYTETPLNVGVVNGSVFCGPPAPGTTATLAIATQARADAQTAYNELAALPPGSDPIHPS